LGLFNIVAYFVVDVKQQPLCCWYYRIEIDATRAVTTETMNLHTSVTATKTSTTETTDEQEDDKMLMLTSDTPCCS